MRLPKLSSRKSLLLLLILLSLVSQLSACAQSGAGNYGQTSRLSSDLPYRQAGQHRVGQDRLAIDLEPALELSVWYPAEGSEDSDWPREYSYEVKFSEPLGTLSIATFEGYAQIEAPPDRSEAPYPIVILSPGFSIRPEAYAWLAEHVASYGFVVLSPDHNERLDPENQLWRSAITRPRDVQVILSYLQQNVTEGDRLAGFIDLKRVAVIGHSYGGYTALAAAGARFDTESFRNVCGSVQGTDEPGAWLCEKLLPHIGDMAELAGLSAVPEGLWPAQKADQVDAIVPLAGDALFFGQPGLAEISVPVLAIGGTADEDAPYAWGTYPAYEFTSSQRKAIVGLVGAGHMIFTGHCEHVPLYLRLFSGEFCSDPTWDRTYAHDLTIHFVTAFLLAELKGDSEAAGELASDYTELAGIDYEVAGYVRESMKP